MSGACGMRGKARMCILCDGMKNEGKSILVRPGHRCWSGI